MPIIEIDGVGRVEVGNEFLSLPPDKQDATVQEIAASARGFGARFDAVNEGARPEMAAPMQRAAQEMMRGPQVSPGTSVAIDFLNQGSAASQRTTPNVNAQAKNLISADVYENDAGEVMFKDPATGQVVPTDQNKHVALRDPADNKVKVYARTDSTNEGVISSAGRLLMTGMAAGAPTRLPGGPMVAAKATQPAPTVEALKSAATAGYQSPDVAAVTVKPQSIQKWTDTLKTSLNESGLDENLAPKTFSVLKRLEAAPEGAVVSGKNIDSLRRTLGHAAGSADATERKAAVKAIEALDDYFTNLPQGDVLTGDATKAAGIVKEARGNYAAAARSQKITDAADSAELQAAAANSGMNLDNATRQKIKSILGNPKARRGYSAEELDQMDRIVRGTFTGNTLRRVGNLLGGGGGLGAAVVGGVGGYATGGWGAMAPLLGYGVKRLSNVVTAREVAKLDEMIRTRSPLAMKIANPVAEWSRASQAFEKNMTPRTFASALIASRNLANNLKDAGITVSPESLLRAIQGPMKSAAEDEEPSVPRRPSQ